MQRLSLADRLFIYGQRSAFSGHVEWIVGQNLNNWNLRPCSKCSGPEATSGEIGLGETVLLQVRPPSPKTASH